MSDAAAFGFGKFIPGFDFLQNLGKAGNNGAALPPFSHWVAPTLSVEDITKRIEELKAVQFWLEQNSKALAATVQALEVQRMTLSTLKGMNVNLSDLAQAFPFAQPPAAQASSQSDLSDWPMSSAASSKPAAPAQAAAQPESAEQTQAPEAASGEPAGQAASVETAMQWWGALTQQFQHIAQQALQDPAQQQAMLKATQMTTDFAKTAVKAARDMVQQAVAQTAAAVKAPAADQPSAAQAQGTKTRKPAAAGRAAAKKAPSSDKKATSASAKPRSRAAAQSPARKTPTR
ncbi:MAG: hypothetical protein Q4B46_05605 [Comamonadaceae bacterium]|nr:hypothetical protein [Comamonadaceae bacterium]